MVARGWGVAIDPGRNTGWVVGHDQTLKNGGVSVARSGCSTDQQAEQLMQGIPLGQYAWCACEEMEFRPTDIKSQAKDLIKVAALGGYVSGHMLAHSKHGRLTMIKPSSWAGGTPQTIRDHRIVKAMEMSGNGPTFKHILKSINPGLREHFFDASGIWLYHVGLTSRGVKVKRS